MAIGTLQVKARVYVTGDTYAIRDRLKAVGCHWDGDRRQWWVGAAKRSELMAVLTVAALGDGPVSSAEAEYAGGTPGMVYAAHTSEVEADRPDAPLKPPKRAEDPHAIRLTGRGEYKGRTYYVGAYTRDGKRCRLLTLPGADGSYLDFWADATAVRVVKTYEPRQAWDGRRYSGRTVTRYTTLGSVADFVRRQQDPATRRGRCTECDAWGPVGEPCPECGGEGSYV